ncbi:MAG: protein kinase, partial [Pyrinomonadaceae bacterium]
MKICPKCGKEYKDTTTLCPADGAVLEKAGDALVGQTLADKYRIEELINQGGMGAVYRGTHVLMDKTVAIKVLHPALAADDKIVARFSREARAASRISHPHALNVTDFGESAEGVVFLVMEYLNGRTLKEMIHDEAPLPLSRIVEIIRQVCGALDAAHAQGVIHRDLKSDNIMLIDVGNGSDWAKVLDFGIAKIQEPVGQDPELTSPNLIIGTPQYMSPEQCSQASEIDARSDIYSLGVILYEMLVGHVPFTGESPTAIMMKHLQEPPPSVLEERRDLPASVGRVVARALAKKPEDRFQSAGELAENLALAVEADAVAVPASASTNVQERDTNRIIVPTDPNIGVRDTANDDYDETTMVRPKREPAPVREEAVIMTDVGPPPDSFKIWRIAIPAVAALLVIFAVVYALKRNSAPPQANDQTQPLTIDQNAQPVQPASPPTGQSEQGITAKLPTETGNTAANANASVPANQNSNADDPSLNGNKNDNANGSNNNTGKSNDNANSDEDNQDEPNPTPTPHNVNQRQQPTPKPSA